MTTAHDAGDSKRGIEPQPPCYGALATEFHGTDAEVFELVRGSVEKLDPPTLHCELAARTGGPVLELFAGRGRRAIQMAKAGYRAVGVDLSEDMLAIARRKADSQGAEIAQRVEFLQADVCRLHLPERFGLIICDDWSFAYLLTQEDQLRCLKTMRRHLTSTGLALIDVFTPHYKLTRDGALEGRTNERVAEIPSQGVRVTQRMKHNFDAVSQIETVVGHILIERPGDEPVSYRTASQLRHTYRWEFELLLKTAGLNVVKRCSDFHDELPLASQPGLNNVENDLAYIVRRSTGGSQGE